AFSYGKEALHLRKKLLKKKFELNLDISGNMEGKRCGQDFSLEVRGPTVAEIWPGSSRSTSMRDSSITPWSLLRCYLESTVQVAMMHELIGNGAEAEVLLQTGKDISNFHGLSVFSIVFTSLLGQLYRKRQLWEEAEDELKYSRNLLMENDTIISCKLCKLTLGISIDIQVGDYFWSLFEKDFQKQSRTNLSSAIDIYQSAIKKLKSTELGFLTGSIDSSKSGCPVCSKECIIPTKHGSSNHGKEPLTSKDGLLPPCSVCVLLRQASVDQCNEPKVKRVQRNNSRNAEAGPPLDVKAKRTSRNSSRLAKEQNLETPAEGRTRSSKRNAHTHSKSSISWSDELVTDASICCKAVCFPDGIVGRKDGLCNMFGCWNCLLVDSINSGCIHNNLQLKLDYVHRHYLLSLLLKTARALGSHGGHYGDHEVHNLYWQCISLLYFRSFPQGCYGTYGPCLVGLIMNGSVGEFLPLECAEILCNLGFFLLKSSLSEQSKDICCSFSSVEMADVVPWLLKAFVLSRESPSLVPEVCKLLVCIFLLSTTDSSIQLPLCSQGSLSLNHWAAYFHQVAVGNYLDAHYLAGLQTPPMKKGIIGDFRNETDGDVLEFLRFSSVDIKHIEKHIMDFFQKLPDVPVVYDSTSTPTTLLLPVDAISEMQFEESSIADMGNPVSILDKKWQCPWGYAITDYVAPIFKNILEENFMSLSTTTHTRNDVKADPVRWWSHRMKLNNYLDNALKDMEESWFGAWKCLLMGHRLSDEHIEAASSSITMDLVKEFKFEVNPVLINAILAGAVSVDEVQECVYQLILYKGYFGRGGCCVKDRFRAFSSHQIDDGAFETLKCLITNATCELSKPVDRGPVILVLDANVQMLPWESLPVLRNQEAYRMPSIASILLALSRSKDHCNDGSAIVPPFPVINPFNSFYLLNPSGDLSSTQEEFDQLFRNYEWKGTTGNPPKVDELLLALKNHDLFLYFGHGSGSQYVPGKEIEKLNNCAAALLMGCSSGTLHCKGSYAPRGAPLSYLFAGSPAIVANLWDVSDKDIDRFSKALLNSWLQENPPDDYNCSKCCQLTQEFESMNISSKKNVRARRQGTRGKKPRQINESTKCCSCRQRRIASYLSEARQACRLPFLIGASPVCYGVPAILRKKVMAVSASGNER
ncbi:hypothetical protein U9M48_021768, partial [Paspalum notatum var. saurae]